MQPLGSNLITRYAPPGIGGYSSSATPLSSGTGLNTGPSADVASMSNPVSGGVGSSLGMSSSPGMGGLGQMLPQLLSIISLMLQVMMSMIGGQTGTGSSGGQSMPGGQPPSSPLGSSAGNPPPSSPPDTSAANPPPSSPPDTSAANPPPSSPPDTTAGNPPPSSPPDSSAGNPPPPSPPDTSAANPPPSSPPDTNAGNPPPTSPPDSGAAGKTNVAGQGPVDPNKPIYVPMVNGKYDTNALDALAKQGLNGIDANTALDDTSKGGDPGAATQAGWTIANGPLSGIKNGAAIAWGCYKNGFTSNDDLINAAGVASIESTNSKNNGQSNGSGYTQKASDNFAPNTGGAEGLFQLDPHWHSTKDAFNPFVNSVRAISVMKTLGKGATIAQDAPAYNTGNAGTTYATAQGGYTTIPGIVADNDNSLRGGT